MSSFLIKLDSGREIVIESAANKGDATTIAVERGDLEKMDLYDIEDILQLTPGEVKKLLKTT